MRIAGTSSIENTADIIDSREIVERIEYLDEQESRDEDEEKELASLKSLQEDAEGYSPDWRYGSTLIRDSYFVDYAEELADDIGSVSGKESWPLNCIDWDKAAEELKQDYTSVEFDGVTYWVR